MIKFQNIHHDQIDAVLFSNDEDESVLITCAEVTSPQVIKQFYHDEDLLIASFDFWSDFLMGSPMFKKERENNKDIIWMLVELFKLDNQVFVKKLISEAINEDGLADGIYKLLR